MRYCSSEPGPCLYRGLILPASMDSQQRSAVATLVERKTRLTMLLPLPNDHTAQSVSDALIKALAPLPAPLRRSLTWDQGNEMFQHARVEAATGINSAAVAHPTHARS